MFGINHTQCTFFKAKTGSFECFWNPKTYLYFSAMLNFVMMHLNHVPVNCSSFRVHNTN